jgi:hypothetical protein
MLKRPQRAVRLRPKRAVFAEQAEQAGATGPAVGPQ